MEVVNELLGYERYKIIQDPEMFHFSIDSILLAYFATITKKMKKVVDFCSGNFPIPMYLTLRTDAEIFGVEIQERAIKLAQDSLALNHLEDRIKVLHQDVKGINNYFGATSVDLVLCNPPFFKVNENSNLNESIAKTYARHEVLITLEDVIKEASIILKDGGYFAMVHRPERLQEILSLMDKYHIAPSRMQIVYPKVGKDANHLLIEGRKGAHKMPNLQILSPLFVYDDNNLWTNEVLKRYNYGKEDI